MQARLLALVAAHRFATTTQLDQLPTLIHGGPAAIPTPQATNQVG